MKKRFSLLVLSALLVAACERPTADVSSDAGPGEVSVGGLVATKIFKDVCRDTLPKFRDAEAKLGASSFEKSKVTGTYFHKTLDLSVKLFSANSRNRCSMVFVSGDDASALAILFGATIADKVNLDLATSNVSSTLENGAVFEFQPITKNRGKQYYRALITSLR